jgi:uncharacterized LabA/DUF88 family protein
MRYVYIDGPALEVAVGNLAMHLGLESIPFDHGMFINNLSADRAFYYDAWPTKRDSDEIPKFEAKEREKQTFFSKLNRYPRLHVRTGTTRWVRGNRQRQKAVDVLLAVDAVTHAYRGTTDAATLVLNDLDFYPVLETLLQTQVRTTLLYRPDTTADELIECADNAQRLSQTLLLKSCEPNFAAPFFPTRDSSSYPLTEQESANAATCTFNGNEVAVWEEAHGVQVAYVGGSRVRAKTRQLAIEYFFEGITSKIEFSDGTQYP